MSAEATSLTPHLTAPRCGTQLRHDKRTIALVILLPCLLIGLIAWMLHGTPVLDQLRAGRAAP